jgi:hypothetical protein
MAGRAEDNNYPLLSFSSLTYPDVLTLKGELMRLHILVLQDGRDLGRALKACLELRGHEVTWFLGVLSVSAAGQKTTITGLLPDGETPEVSLAGYHLAFVDGMLNRGNFQGRDLIHVLVKAGVLCAADSKDSTLNQDMKKQGASFVTGDLEVLDKILAQVCKRYEAKQPC